VPLCSARMSRTAGWYCKTCVYDTQQHQQQCVANSKLSISSAACKACMHVDQGDEKRETLCYKMLSAVVRIRVLHMLCTTFTHAYTASAHTIYIYTLSMNTLSCSCLTTKCTLPMSYLCNFANISNVHSLIVATNTTCNFQKTFVAAGI
jgi:hypothetical protein